MRALLYLVSVALEAQSWITQVSGTDVTLRGVSAVSEKVAWASGQKGTFLRTLDGGATWRAGKLPDASDLDFRDVQAFDAKTAFLLSAGPGLASRIYKTVDGGERWTLQMTNPDKDGFWDCFSFWDETHGIVVGDPVDGRFTVMTTKDGSRWIRQKGPQALPMEGAFAASGTCVSTRGTREAWFATGGPGGARAFHSTDGGETWTVSKTPVRNDSSNAGVFSVAFADGGRGVAVGGDYSKPSDGTSSGAITNDAGKTWSPIALPGYRSVVAYSPSLKLWIAAGTSGSDVSVDGKEWKSIGAAAINAVSFAGSTGWAVGPAGYISAFQAK